MELFFVKKCREKNDRQKSAALERLGARASPES
jgi:hypothetical protein